MTISSRLTTARETMRQVLADCGVELARKGVTLPQNANLSDLAYYISLIFQSDFEWMFNFHKIDQFGNPHTENLGQPVAEGPQLYNPSFEMIPPFVFNFNENQNELNSQGLTDGAFGVYGGGTSGINPGFDLQQATTFIFNEEILPVTLEASNDN